VAPSSPMLVDGLCARAGGAPDHPEHDYKAQTWRCSVLCNPSRLMFCKLCDW
jgi:hypothetical protein